MAKKSKPKRRRRGRTCKLFAAFVLVGVTFVTCTAIAHLHLQRHLQQPPAAPIARGGSSSRSGAAESNQKRGVLGSFRGKGEGYVMLDEPMEVGAEMALAVWVWLEPSNTEERIKTLVSNRESGCTVSRQRDGWSLSVNSWQSNDRRLVLEWGGANSGCEKLSTEEGAIPLGEWTHVAVIMVAAAAAGARAARADHLVDLKLLINGEVVARAEGQQRHPQQQQSLFVGTMADIQNSFVGNATMVRLWSGPCSELRMRRDYEEHAGSLRPKTPASVSAAEAEAGDDGGHGQCKLQHSFALDEGVGAENSLDSVSGRREGTYHWDPGSVGDGGIGAGERDDGEAEAELGEAGQGQIVTLENASPFIYERVVVRGDNVDARAHRSAISSDDKSKSANAPQTSSGSLLAVITAALAAILGASTATETPTAAPMMAREEKEKEREKEMKESSVGEEGPALAGHANSNVTGADQSSTFVDTVRKRTAEVQAKADTKAERRAARVKAAMRHAWGGYSHRAFGQDEVTPISGRGQDNWGGLGATLVDALDTLWIMRMDEEFEWARRWVAGIPAGMPPSGAGTSAGAGGTDTDPGGDEPQRRGRGQRGFSALLEEAGSRSVSTFEVTIRIVGGLLSAHSLSGDRVFLDKAAELATQMLKAFDTPSGIPDGHVKIGGRDGGGAGDRGGMAQRATQLINGAGMFMLRGSVGAVGGVGGRGMGTGMGMGVGPSRHTRRATDRFMQALGHGHSHDSQVTLAEIGTLSLEFRYLSKHTGNPAFARAVDGVYEQLLRTSNEATDGLWPVRLSVDTNANHRADARSGPQQPSPPRFATGHVTWGGAGDSFYEYLLKGWIQAGRPTSAGPGGGSTGGQPKSSVAAGWSPWPQNHKLRELYDSAVDGLHKRLLQRSMPSGLAYIAEISDNGHALDPRMDHLACFAPGTLALGAYRQPPSARRDRDVRTAKALMYTCVQMYLRTPTGVAPEYVQFVNRRAPPASATGSSERERDPGDFVVPPTGAKYILRPEVAESLFILHELTRDPVYREWGHRIFVAIERHCRTNFGYASLIDVRNHCKPHDACQQTGKRLEDKMESFFLAETLKYLYLLQKPDHGVSLDRFVFNTEAHPLLVD